VHSRRSTSWFLEGSDTQGTAVHSS
jgi:hypothetical protein